MFKIKPRFSYTKIRCNHLMQAVGNIVKLYKKTFGIKQCGVSADSPIKNDDSTKTTTNIHGKIVKLYRSTIIYFCMHVYELLCLEGNYIFTGVVNVTLNFHPQGRNVNDVTNEGKS